jgi:hypothetical protein
MSKRETLIIRATHPDRPVPMERDRVKIDKATGRDRTMVYHDEPRTVPNNAFYRRAIRRGDAVEVRALTKPAKPADAAKPKKD